MDTEWLELTHYRVPGVAEEELVEPEVISYPSFDGLDIEALYFKAREDVSNGHLILWPHGGPQYAERKTFRSLFQFLVNRGYSIFAPNFRGSTGYGLSFSKMVEGDWGHGPRLDNINGLEWMIDQGYADRDKVLLMGGSYGGYMTLLLAGRHPEYFKACIDIFGPSNLFSFIETVPEHWKPMIKQVVGDPIKDKVKLTADSPITYLDQMIKPMLVIQGANDPRVVKAESDQIVDALKSKGVDVEYMVLENEGHGFSKKENEMKVYRKGLEFLDRFI
jgi:dipeptidyl aminopeptidase/acylaminoacyl peptidase